MSKEEMPSQAELAAALKEGHSRTYEVLLEAMDIVAKYDKATRGALLECGIEELQTDAMRLTALNFYIGTLASGLEVDAQIAENVRKYWEARIYLDKADGRRVDDIKREAEVGITQYRSIEAEALRRAKMVCKASESIVEMVNMLKKVCERILAQGMGHNV